jgi:hypothetical protein
MPAHRLLTATAAAVLLAGPAQGELIIISPNTVPIPPFSILKESIRKLNGADVSPARYITFLGTWENNGSANWERETWWGRFYVDCKDETFKVYHFKHKHIGNGWRSINKNGTAFWANANICPQMQELPEEAKAISLLDKEFTKDYHNESHPFKTNPSF